MQGSDIRNIGSSRVAPDELARHANTPAGAFDDGREEFAEIYGSATANSARMFVLACLALILSIAMAITVATLLPLKETAPWLVPYDKTSGLVDRPIEVVKVTPNEAVVKAELAKWVDWVYTIDTLRTTELYKSANSRARDKAIGQFTEFRIREKTFERIQKEPGLSREVKVSSVDASQTGIAFVFLTTTERSSAGQSSADKVKRYRLTLHYQLDPPKNQADLLVNPLGIYVTFFNEAEEKAN